MQILQNQEQNIEHVELKSPYIACSTFGTDHCRCAASQRVASAITAAYGNLKTVTSTA